MRAQQFRTISKTFRNLGDIESMFEFNPFKYLDHVKYKEHIVYVIELQLNHSAILHEVFVKVGATLNHLSVEDLERSVKPYEVTKYRFWSSPVPEDTFLGSPDSFKMTSLAKDINDRLRGVCRVGYKPKLSIKGGSRKCHSAPFDYVVCVVESLIESGKRFEGVTAYDCTQEKIKAGKSDKTGTRQRIIWSADDIINLANSTNPTNPAKC